MHKSAAVAITSSRSMAAIDMTSFLIPVYASLLMSSHFCSRSMQVVGEFCVEIVGLRNNSGMGERL